MKNKKQTSLEAKIQRRTRALREELAGQILLNASLVTSRNNALVDAARLRAEYATLQDQFNRHSGSSRVQAFRHLREMLGIKVQEHRLVTMKLEAAEKLLKGYNALQPDLAKFLASSR